MSGPTETYPARRRLADLAFDVVFFGWLFGVPFLLGVGLIRRITVLPFNLSLERAMTVGAQTDAFLVWGLVLNAVLPVAGALGAALFARRQLGRFGGAVLTALAIYVAMALIASAANGRLFGHVPRWEKPRAAAVAPHDRRKGPTGIPEPAAMTDSTVDLIRARARDVHPGPRSTPKAVDSRSTTVIR